MTREQLRKIINEAHEALHSGDAEKAHEILHEAASPEEGAGSMTMDPEVQEAVSHFMEAAEGKLPCDHTIGDLIHDPVKGTRCGACVQDRQPNRDNNNVRPDPTEKSLNHYTADQVKAAMIAEGIIEVPHHDCGICGIWVRYIRKGDQLYFDSGCDCSSRGGMEPRNWSDASDWINMQSRPDIKRKLAGQFGILNDHEQQPETE